MSSEEYQPISCALHSEYELLAMHRTPIKVTPDEGSAISGIITDIQARPDAEYLIIATGKGSNIEIRLDKIKRITSI